MIASGLLVPLHSADEETEYIFFSLFYLFESKKLYILKKDYFSEWI